MTYFIPVCSYHFVVAVWRAKTPESVRMKTNTLSLLFIPLLYFSLSLTTQAVNPPPDGGYPGGNTAEGQNALLSLTSGGLNTAIGWLSLRALTFGQFNTGVGAGTLALNAGGQNTATGAGALLGNTTGGGNTASGYLALFSNTTGVANAAIGEIALYNNTTGNFNTALGAGAGSNVTTASNVTCVGANVFGADVDNTTWIGNVYGVTTQNGTTAPVVVSADGQLGVVASSERFKKDIATMEKTSEAILSLRPVTFHYKTDIKGVPQFGLIAEEVAKVNPALVLPDKEGKPFTVRYDAVNAMLLNEFLKEHQTVQKQQKEINALKAELKEQRALIQNVNDKVQLGKAAPQTVLNNQ
jgi:hypothetical protein